MHHLLRLIDLKARKEGLKNYLSAMSEMIPPDGSPRRLSGYPTFGIGYGNTFVIGLDSDISPDETQFNWVKHQLEGLNRSRFVHVIACWVERSETRRGFRAGSSTMAMSATPEAMRLIWSRATSG